MLDFLKRYQFNLYYLGVICVLAWVIGTDTNGSLFWAVPVWYVMIGIALQKLWPWLRRFWWVLVLILVLQGMEENVFRPIPDYAPEKISYRIPLLTVICNDGCSMESFLL